MFEINNKVHENKINFLYEAATTILPKANASLMVLKSFYINKSRHLAHCENLSIPNKIYGSSAMCQKCSVPWGEGTCKALVYSTKPKKLKHNNFIIAQKTKRDMKKFKKYIVLKCTVCKNRTKQVLSKPVIAKMDPSTQLVKKVTTHFIEPNNGPQITASSNKKSKIRKSKVVPNKSIQKSKKPNQNHILQLAKLLSSGNNRSTILSHEDKLKQFLK